MPHDPVEALRNEIAKGRVLAIVGAGISIGATKNAPTASWTGLLENGVDRCLAAAQPLPDGWADRVRAEIHSGDMDDLLSAAEKISRKLGFPNGGNYRSWLRDAVGSLRADDRSVLEALRGLGIPLATTNYDGLLEEVTGLPPVTWREGAKVERVIRGDEKGILHLHGYWDQPESVILGIHSYQEILGDAHAQNVLKALRTVNTLLFVGYGEGLSDPNFRALLKWTRDVFTSSPYPHYRLCRNSEAPDLRKLHPKKEPIVVLPYGPSHVDLAPFLRNLRPAVFPKPEEKKEEEPSPETLKPNSYLVSSMKEDPARKLRVFLCHSSGDKPAVRKLYGRLLHEGMNPWLDEEDLLPGQDWQLEISKAVRTSDVVIVCLSKGATTKSGFVQREIQYALDIAYEQPEGATFLIPVKLEECKVPDRLQRWQWVDLFDDKGHQRLIRSLLQRRSEIDQTHESATSPDQLHVPDKARFNPGKHLADKSEPRAPISKESLIVTLENGEAIECRPNPFNQGATGELYWTKNGREVIKIFLGATSSDESKIRALLNEYNVTIGDQRWRELFAWPRALIIHPSLGVVFPAANQEDLREMGLYISPRLRNKIMKSKVDIPLAGYIGVAIKMAQIVARLDEFDLVHMDLSSRNFLINPAKERAMLIDLDAIAVPGFPHPSVTTNPSYMAPEVNMQITSPGRQIVPSPITVRHTLATLIYSLLFQRHPLVGPKSYSPDPEVDEALMFGERALFIEHPDDTSNRPKHLSTFYTSLLTLPLQRLVERAFIDGLHFPERRPKASEWVQCLSEMRASL